MAKLEISQLNFDQIKANLKQYLSNQNTFKDYDFEGSGMAVLLDLLAYNNQILSSKKLVIPHPRLHERNFVLFPILDLNPNWIHPILKKSVRDLVEKSKNIQKIKKMELRVE